MKEISLHVLDLIENAVAAGATAVVVVIDEDIPADRLRLSVQDDGAGMPPEIADRAADPFATTRTTRSVGMGLALLSGASEQAGGRLDISGAPGVGTRIEAEFQLTNIDRAPLGRIEDTLAATALVHPDLDLRFTHRGPNGTYELSVLSLAQETDRGTLRAEISRLIDEGRRRIGSVA
jgi:hypothetical protein